MHLKVLGSILFLLMVVHQPTLKDVSITWKASKPLTWADFKGKPKPNSSAVAQTVSGITFGYSIKTMDGRIVDYTATIEAHFYPHKSWYLKDKADAYILKHEQLHFDITELYARLFRKNIKSLRVNQNLKRQLDDLQKSINEAVNETQKRYDSETNHSINKEAQLAWEVRIAKELELLNTFASK